MYVLEEMNDGCDEICRYFFDSLSFRYQGRNGREIIIKVDQAQAQAQAEGLGALGLDWVELGCGRDSEEGEGDDRTTLLMSVPNKDLLTMAMCVVVHRDDSSHHITKTIIIIIQSVVLVI